MEFVDAPTHVAVMLACVGTVTALVVTGNVAIVAPAATVTEPGTGTLAFGVAARQRHHRTARRRRAGECHCAGAAGAADQYGRVHRQGTQQRVHDEPD